MATQEQIDVRNNKFYTPSGLSALKGRFRTILSLFNENKFPFRNQMLGFSYITIATQEEAMSRLRELAELIGMSFKLEKQTIVTEDNKQITTEKVKEV